MDEENIIEDDDAELTLDKVDEPVFGVSEQLQFRAQPL